MELGGAKPLYIAAIYRPNEGDAESIAELRHSLEKST